MLSRIARLELSNQLRSPPFFVAFALFFLCAFGRIDRNSNDNGLKVELNAKSTGL
jgi:hypothetical protein